MSCPIRDTSLRDFSIITLTIPKHYSIHIFFQKVQSLSIRTGPKKILMVRSGHEGPQFAMSIGTLQGAKDFLNCKILYYYCYTQIILSSAVLAGHSIERAFVVDFSLERKKIIMEKNRHILILKVNRSYNLNAGQKLYVGFHLHLLVFPFVNRFNFRTGVLVHSSFAKD